MNRLKLGWLNLLIVLGLVATTMAAIGWFTDIGPTVPESWRGLESRIYVTFRAVALDGAYSDEARVKGSFWLIAARWLGLLCVSGGAVLAAVTLLRGQLLRARAYHGGAPRVLVLGDHPLASWIARACGQSADVTHHTATVSEPDRIGRVTRLPPAPAGSTQLPRNLTQIVVAEADYGVGIERALRLRERTEAPIALHVDDPWASARMHHVSAGAAISPFSEAQAAARQILIDHPPVVLAARKGQAAIHAVVIGLTGVAEALIVNLSLNGQLATSERRPLVTVVDGRGEASLAGLKARHPEIHAVCDIQVVTTMAGIADAGRGVTGCALYVCADDTTEAFADAVAAREEGFRNSDLSAPIFVRLRQGTDMLPRPLGVSALEDHRLYGFGGLPDLPEAAGLLDDPIERLAQTAHEDYLTLADTLFGPGGGSPARQPWDSLAEEFRIANRRLVEHSLTKLHHAGFDLEPWLALPPQQRPWPPSIREGESLFRDAAELDQLSRLEHRRWMADRQVNGWRLGPRGDGAKRHPDLVPFDALSAATQSFDTSMVRWLDNQIARTPEGLIRSKTIVG